MKYNSASISLAIVSSILFIGCSSQQTDFRIDTTGFGGDILVVGTLVVDIHGLGPGETLEEGLVVSGYGFRKVIHQSTTFSNIYMGFYKVETPPAVQFSQDPIVSGIFEKPNPASEQNVTLLPGRTERVSVTYTKRQGTGHLWAENQGTSLIYGHYAYSSSTLAGLTSTVSEPAASIIMDHPGSSFGGFSTFFEGPTFSPTGEMWGTLTTGTLSDHRTAAYLSSSLVNNKNAVPDMGFAPYGYLPTFDRSGNMWVRTGDVYTASKNLLRTPSSMLSSPMATPDIKIDLATTTVTDLAVDDGNNLWIATGDESNGKIYMIPNATTAGTYNLSSFNSIELTSTTEKVGRIKSIAFDRSGNLWASSLVDAKFDMWGREIEAKPRIIRIPNTDLSTTGSPKLDIKGYAQIGYPKSNTRGFTSLAFDNSGKLWTDLYASDLVTGASFLQTWQQEVSALAPGINMASPSKRMNSTTWGFAFNPPPCGLPIYGSRSCPMP